MKLTPLLLISGITACAPLAATTAAERPAARGAGLQQIQQSLRELNLSEDQQTKLRTFFSEHGETLRGLREDTSLSSQDKLAKFQEFQTAFRAKAKEVLTAEQFAQWEKSRAGASTSDSNTENSVRRPESEKPAEPAPSAATTSDSAAGNLRERMQGGLAELNLGSEQQEKMRSATQEQMEAMKALSEDQSLSREDKLAKFQAMQTQNSAKMKEILTAEQFAKWEKQRGNLAEGLRRRAKK